MTDLDPKIPILMPQSLLFQRSNSQPRPVLDSSVLTYEFSGSVLACVALSSWFEASILIMHQIDAV